MTYFFPADVQLSMDDSYVASMADGLISLTILFFFLCSRMVPSGPRYHVYSVAKMASSVESIVNTYFNIHNDTTTVFQYVYMENNATPAPVQLSVASRFFFS